MRSYLAFILLLRTTAFVLPRPPRTASVTVRAESVEELQAAAAKLREEIKVEEASLAAATAEKNALAQERDAEKAAERAEKAKVKNAQKRQKVLTLCRDRNATAVGLVLLNDGVNKRKDVEAALDRAGVKEAERIMQRAHRNGAALIDRFDSLNDTYAFEPAYDTYAKLNDRGLNVAFVPVPADDGDELAGADVAVIDGCETIAMNETTRGSIKRPCAGWPGGAGTTVVTTVKITGCFVSSPARNKPPSSSRREPTSPQAPQTWDDDAASAARSRRSSATTDASAPPSVPATRSVAASRRASLEWPTASNVSEASVPARTSTA